MQSTGARGTPDVALNADPNTGVYVYDSYYYGGWLQVGGTSLAAPVWAGLIGIANQGRAATKLNTLSNVPADLYSLPASDFHDVTSGNNGYAAGPGYDFVTGLGTPKANVLVPALASATLPASTVQSPVVHPAATNKPTPPGKTQLPSNLATLFVVQSAPATRSFPAGRRDQFGGNSERVLQECAACATDEPGVVPGGPDTADVRFAGAHSRADP